MVPDPRPGRRKGSSEVSSGSEGLATESTRNTKMKNPIQDNRIINGIKVFVTVTIQTYTEDGKEIINPQCCVAYKIENEPRMQDGTFLRNEDGSLKWYQTPEEAAEAAFNEAYKDLDK